VGSKAGPGGLAGSEALTHPCSPLIMFLLVCQCDFVNDVAHAATVTLSWVNHGNGQRPERWTAEGRKGV
jgi:hypothetical protein